MQSQRVVNQSSLLYQVQAMQHLGAIVFTLIPSLIMTVCQWLTLIPQAQVGLNQFPLKLFTVDLSAASTQNVTVDLQLRNCTGSGTDYTLANGT
ncbi:MAG: hypothetical protein CM15mP86_14790 [Gammaproteobacteria bacterium]|nr:MAG: hypothetical protein CM15mP86_14790 [Gammaproteobacteria bacterium]